MLNIPYPWTYNLFNMTTPKIYKQYYEYPIPFNPEEGIDAFTPVEEAPYVEDVSIEFKEKNCYSSNIALMRGGLHNFPYTKEMENEIEKCMDDIFYFISNYCKIMTLKNGVQLFKLFQYQKNAIKVMSENRFSIFKFPRQMGKCVEEDTEISIRMNGVEYDITIGQLYNLVTTENLVESYTPNNEYQILTEDGFKNFDGITTRFTDEIINIKLDNGKSFKVTPKHEVKLYNGEFITADLLKVNDLLGLNDYKNKIIDIEYINKQTKVADVISVEDTASYIVDDMSAILSNCIDPESNVTLLDNLTGKIFTIHISELYDYLKEGSK